MKWVIKLRNEFFVLYYGLFFKMFLCLFYVLVMFLNVYKFGL